MKLPWISREAHEAVLAEKEARIQDGKDALAQANATADHWRTLYEEAIRPKVEILSPPTATLSPKEPNIVLQTIRELAQGDQRMAGYLHKRKRELRREHPNISDDMLCVELQRWETSDSAFEEAVP